MSTEYIAHRINTKEELLKLPEEYGVELDLRDDLNGRIYICHNPFEPGEDFEEYCKVYHHGTMILNIKSERIEHKALEYMEKYQIKNYFFLDSSFPMIKLLTDMGVKQVALRFSELEGLDTIRNMAGRAEWVWVDCFTKVPVDRESFAQLKALGYKLCFVSPELEGQEEKIFEYKKYIKEQGIIFDAVCTKSYHIKDWM